MAIIHIALIGAETKMLAGMLDYFIEQLRNQKEISIQGEAYFVMAKGVKRKIENALKAEVIKDLTE